MRYQILKKIILVCLISVFIFSAFITNAQIKPDHAGYNKMISTASTNSSIDFSVMNINNISFWIYANGSANPENYAALYPRGTVNILYCDGMIWAGKAEDGLEPLIRAGGQRYAVGTQPGCIISKGIAEDPNDPEVNHVWRIRRDFADMEEYELRDDAAEYFNIPVNDVNYNQMELIADLYREDWIQWPADKGAPFYDADGDGRYTPQFDSTGAPILYPQADEPGIADADQVIWLVYNDLDSLRTYSFAGSDPIGLEVQVTLWGYKRYDALGNILFKRVQFIYKGREGTPTNAYIDSMYIGQFSDPDIGEYGDDLIGCDTLLNFGYAYNSSQTDEEYNQFNLNPPSVGYDFLTGPIVPGPASTAIFNLKPLTGYRNLPLTSFILYVSFSLDKPNSYPDYLELWNCLRGFQNYPTPTPWINPRTGDTTKFVFSGDPVGGTGWIDTLGSDKRMILASGPFSMALGDTNEISIALTAGIGSDRLTSISAMKFYDRVAQNLIDNFFPVPQVPHAPKLTATEMETEILLSWSQSQQEVEKIEKWQKNGYHFEGYNLYQLPSKNASKSDWLKLETYDVKDKVKIIFQEDFDPNAGGVIRFPIQSGSDRGIVRSKLISWDKINNQGLLIGQEYYFALTVYNYNPDASDLYKSMESAPSIVTVIPQSLKPGTKLHAAMGDTIPVEHVQGNHEGEVRVIVTNPYELTGDDYNIGFTGDYTTTTWYLTNTASGDTLLNHQTNISGDDNYLITDGFQARVISTKQDFKDFQCIANADGLLNPPEGAAADRAGFPGLGLPSDRQQVGGGHWLIHTGMSPDLRDFNYETFIDRITDGGKNWIKILSDNFEIRFTAEGSKALVPASYNNSMNQLIDVPFELWNIGEIDNPNDDVRYFVYVWDVDQNGEFNLVNEDHGVFNGNYDPYTDWFDWAIPVDETPGRTGYDELAAMIASDVSGYQYLDGTNGIAMSKMVLVNWGGGLVDDGIYNQDMPEQGTVFRILTRKPLTTEDVFTFSTEDYNPTTTLSDARNDVQQITVYPNPYYGVYSASIEPPDHFVTFCRLPEKAIIRIFTLSGFLVNQIEKDNESQFVTWNLLNRWGRLVAAGLYVVHIEMPEINATKILKLAVFPR